MISYLIEHPLLILSFHLQLYHPIHNYHPLLANRSLPTASCGDVGIVLDPRFVFTFNSELIEVD